MHFIEDKAEKYYHPYDLPFMGYNNYSLVGEWFAYCHAERSTMVPYWELRVRTEARNGVCLFLA